MKKATKIRVEKGASCTDAYLKSVDSIERMIFEHTEGDRRNRKLTTSLEIKIIVEPLKN